MSWPTVLLLFDGTLARATIDEPRTGTVTALVHALIDFSDEPKGPKAGHGVDQGEAQDVPLPTQS